MNIWAGAESLAESSRIAGLKTRRSGGGACVQTWGDEYTLCIALHPAYDHWRALAQRNQQTSRGQVKESQSTSLSSRSHPLGSRVEQPSDRLVTTDGPPSPAQCPPVPLLSPPPHLLSADPFTHSRVCSSDLLFSAFFFIMFSSLLSLN